MNHIITQIRIELKNNSDETTKKSFQRFFKEKVIYYGVKTGIVNKIAKKYWKEIKGLDKKEIFGLCEELYSSGFCEEAFIAADWLPNLSDKFEEKDFYICEKWIERYIDNWAKCDSFCNHTVADFIDKYPKLIEKLKIWTKSDNRWLKRASAVSLIIPARRGRFLKDIFEISDALLLDGDDMVQKGYGWMLKEASRLHQKEVFEYIIKHKNKMPRTALRYAIEKMPDNMRKKAME
ncbi:MAG: DNA alkylation repair protein [bacterium]|nr:DNA alkylation repair protein [bacterium]